MVGGGEDSMVASGVIDRLTDARLLDAGTCDDGGGVIDGEVIPGEEPATIIDVVGDATLGMSELEGSSAP